MFLGFVVASTEFRGKREFGVDPTLIPAQPCSNTQKSA